MSSIAYSFHNLPIYIRLQLFGNFSGAYLFLNLDIASMKQNIHMRAAIISNKSTETIYIHSLK